MKALIVYESFFGNTEKLARSVCDALCDALGGEGVCRMLRAADATNADVASADLLIVGTPTRAFRASPDTQSFLRRLAAGSLSGKRAAAFDTRMDVTVNTPKILKILAGLFGYAAEPTMKALSRLGARSASAPAWFFVEGSEGPLRAGELERAAAWAKSLQ
jgi:flavodoxin